MVYSFYIVFVFILFPIVSQARRRRQDHRQVPLQWDRGEQVVIIMYLRVRTSSFSGEEKDEGGAAQGSPNDRSVPLLCVSVCGCILHSPFRPILDPEAIADRQFDDQANLDWILL